MKKKQNQKFGPLGIVFAVVLLAFGIYFITNKTKNSELKSYTSEALKISFRYPKDWRMIEYPNVIVIGNNQTSFNFGNNVDLIPPTKEEIAVKVSLIHTLQNQSLSDYIKEAEKNSISSKSIGSIKIDGTEAIIREASYSINNNKLLYRYLYLERNNDIYSISAMPADSELIPFFNHIVDSIEFK